MEDLGLTHLNLLQPFAPVHDQVVGSVVADGDADGKPPTQALKLGLYLSEKSINPIRRYDYSARKWTTLGGMWL